MINTISKQLTAAMIVSVAISIFNAEPTFAQGQAGQNSPHATGTHNNDKKGNVSSDINADKSISRQSMDMFVEKASESNLAEIELSKIAVKKASSEEIREFAQMMIEHHTKAQVELYSVVSDLASSDQSISGNDTNDETNIESTANDADKTATLGGTGDTTGNSMAQGKTNGEFNSNRSGVDRDNATLDKSSAGASEPGTNTENNASNINADTTANTRMPGNNADTANITSRTQSNSSNHISMENGSLPTELSAEHRELMRKLSILSGAEFDRQYMQAMLNDHKKAIELFEKQALHLKNTNLQSYASKMLPVIKDHYQMAQQLNR